MPNLLVIDDDPFICEIFMRIAEKLDLHCRICNVLAEGMAILEKETFDIVLLDVCLPDGNGLNHIAAIKEIPSSPDVIIITAFGDPDGAELAIQNGAWDYLVKPSSVEQIMLTIRRALDYRKEKKTSFIPALFNRDEIVGSSQKLNACLERVAQAATNQFNVLIIGETGTGKELFARAIHTNSQNRENRFIVVDCASIPESLVESTLFGHEKGAYTGADKEREGLIKQAEKGTLFLDEIGELPLSIQKTFLRVIQERKVRPVSGKNEIPVHFRLIAATNRDLDEMVREGQFRDDLLFRLKSCCIYPPPLRERKEDIRILASFYVEKLCKIYGIGSKEFSSDFFNGLSLYSWPGNVRELFNTMEEVLSVAQDEPTLFIFHLPIHIRSAIAKTTVEASIPEPILPPTHTFSEVSPDGEMISISNYRKEMDRRYLSELIEKTGGNRKEACRISGLSRTRLFELLKKHHIS